MTGCTLSSCWLDVDVNSRLRRNRLKGRPLANSATASLVRSRAISRVRLFQLRKLAINMSESALQPDQVPALVCSLHFSDDSSPVKKQRLLAPGSIDLLVGQVSLGSRGFPGLGFGNLIFDGLALPSSCHYSTPRYRLPVGMAGTVISLKSEGTENSESSSDFRSTRVASIDILTLPSSIT